VKPVFVINSLSETVARKGSKLAPLAELSSAIFDNQIFEQLNLIVAAGKKAGWVIIEGGDGTAQGIISAFFNQLDDISAMPKFTLLPGGMTNQVAKNIGLKAFSDKSLRALLNAPSKDVQVPMLKVSPDDLPDLYGFLFPTGGVPMVTRYTKDKIHSRGVGGSAAVVGGIIKGITGRDDSVLHPTEISLHVNDEHVSGSHLGTLVTTLSSLLLGLDPFWGNGNGPLRVTYVEGHAKRLPAHVAGLWIGRKNKDRRADGLHSYRAAQLDYDYAGPTVLDGEPISLSAKFSVTATQPLTFTS